MHVFSIGYMVSFFSINLNKKVLHKFSDGPSTPFQRKVSLYSVILLFILLALLGGPFFESENWRLIWLGALLATGIHFFPYYFVHGKSMIFLGLACVINAAVGYLSPQSSLVTIAYFDAIIKLAFGLYFSYPNHPKHKLILEKKQQINLVCCFLIFRSSFEIKQTMTLVMEIHDESACCTTP